jgi:hypothetical protein
MARRSTYYEIGYGEWTRPRMRDFREQCCDCGLIHRLDFRIVDAKGRSRPSSRSKGRSRPSSRLHVEFRTRRDDRCTPTLPVHPGRLAATARSFSTHSPIDAG